MGNMQFGRYQGSEGESSKHTVRNVILAAGAVSWIYFLSAPLRHASETKQDQAKENTELLVQDAPVKQEMLQAAAKENINHIIAVDTTTHYVIEKSKLDQLMIK